MSVSKPSVLICLLLVLVVPQFVCEPAVAYELPVSGPVVDPWRPPINQYASGNRGVDFATAAGTDVLSSEDGVVTFAGQVGGVNYVVVQHDDGLRTTYGGVNTVLVGAGHRVREGTRIALAGLILHFGLRDGDRYLDPISVIDRSIRLVPLDASNVALRHAVTDSAIRWATSAAIPAPKALSATLVASRRSTTTQPQSNPNPLAPELLVGLALLAALMVGAGFRMGRSRVRPRSR